ncbi:MAG: enoyl-CoA hydratase/isomerase family protein [Thermoleophilaceae bacterium]|jgi:enoyl-CoA hydratase/carnithine racemase
MAAATVHAQREGRVMVVRLDNPPRNFMTGAMVEELHALVTALEGDRSVGAVLVTGAPEDIFITHFDVQELVAGSEGVGRQVPAAVAGGALRAAGALARVPGAEAALDRSPASGLVGLNRIHDVFLRMNRLDKVFVAAVNGLALGGGCELALACDIRLMAERESARIGLPEVSLGIIPGAGGTQRLARALGPARALELMLEATPLTAEEAVAAGVVHRAIDPERLFEEAFATAERLARRSPAAVGALKRAVYEGSSRSLPEGLRLERAGFLAAASSAPALRAMRAYAAEVERLDGDSVPWDDEEFLGRWREGTAVDMTSA